MDDAVFVSVLHRPGQGPQQLRGGARRLRHAVEVLGQAAAVEVLQREERETVVLADLVDLHNVGMVQPGHRLGLGAEAGQVFRLGLGAGQDHLQGDEALELRLPRLVDHAHAAAAEQAQHLIARHDRQRRGRSGRRRRPCQGAIHPRRVQGRKAIEIVCRLRLPTGAAPIVNVQQDQLL
jgi:hypothetical protein